MGMFSKLFGKAPDSENAAEISDSSRMNAFAGLTFEDAVTRFKGMGASVDIRVLYALWKRMYEIALLDHHVPDAVREQAFGLAEAVESDLNKGAETQDPKAREAMAEAVGNWKGTVKYVGYGSLHWLAEEQAVPSEKLVEFMMKPEHGRLLANALVVVESTLPSVRPELVRELVRTRRGKSLNAVLALFGCASARDPATEALFNAEELKALRFAHRDYSAARQVPVGLGLLRAESVGIEKIALPELGVLEYPLMMLVKESLDGANDTPEIKEYVESLSEEWRQTFRLASAFLSLGIVLAHTRWLYGEQGEAKIREYFKTGAMRNTWGGEYERLVDLVLGIEERAYQTPQVSPGWLAFDAMLNYGKPEQSEAEYNATAKQEFRGGELLVAHRVEILEKLRFVVRQYSQDLSEQGEQARKEAAANPELLLEDFVA